MYSCRVYQDLTITILLNIFKEFQYHSVFFFCLETNMKKKQGNNHYIRHIEVNVTQYSVFLLKRFQLSIKILSGIYSFKFSTKLKNLLLSNSTTKKKNLNFSWGGNETDLNLCLKSKQSRKKMSRSRNEVTEGKIKKTK